MKTQLKCSIGICVYNEEKNIVKLLQSLISQILHRVKMDQILVVASGTVDKTSEIVEIYRKKDKRIKLVKQKKRLGKASAVNLFIKRARNKILVLLGGDLLLTPNTIERLVSKFTDPEVGMTGARPIPINDKNTSFSNYAGHFLWELHHRVSLHRPKMGEVVAFRKNFTKISTFIGADEANIEPLILAQGYRIVYVEDARVYNKTPTILREYIKQRRRNYWLHLAVKNEQRYIVSTLDTGLLISAVASFLRDNHQLHDLLFTPAVIGLEIISRFLGWWDYKISKKNYTVWETVKTTKDL